MKLEARIIRHWVNKEVATEDDYIECLIKCWDKEKQRYYWGMSWRWDYKNMNKYAEYDAYDVADKLFTNIRELQKAGYKITFLDEAI